MWTPQPRARKHALMPTAVMENLKESPLNLNRTACSSDARSVQRIPAPEDPWNLRAQISSFARATEKPVTTSKPGRGPSKAEVTNALGSSDRRLSGVLCYFLIARFIGRFARRPGNVATIPETMPLMTRGSDDLRIRDHQATHRHTF